MKRVIVFLVIAGLTTMFTFGQKKEIRSVSDFTGIDASGAFDITVTKGDMESLTIEANDEVMQYVRSEVKNGVLRLYLEKGAQKKVKNIKPLKASVVMKDLDKVSLSGACKITANDLFTPESFNGNCAGSSDMTINVNTGQLNIKASGSSKIRMKANVTGNAKMNVSGSSNIQGELKVNDMTFTSSGSNKVDLTGSATDMVIDVAGSSKFNAGGFIVKTTTIQSSGSCKITINAVDTLKIHSSGSSTITYKGSPAIEINSSGSSKVKKE